MDSSPCLFISLLFSLHVLRFFFFSFSCWLCGFCSLGAFARLWLVCRLPGRTRQTGDWSNIKKKSARTKPCLHLLFLFLVWGFVHNPLLHHLDLFCVFFLQILVARCWRVGMDRRWWFCFEERRETRTIDECGAALSLSLSLSHLFISHRQTTHIHARTHKFRALVCIRMKYHDGTESGLGTFPLLYDGFFTFTLLSFYINERPPPSSFILVIYYFIYILRPFEVQQSILLVVLFIVQFDLR